MKNEGSTIKAKALKDFTLAKFNEIKIIQRAYKEEEGKVFKNDIIECKEDMADYLLGNNAKKEVVIELMEVIPEKEEIRKVEEVKEEPKKEVKKTTKNKKKK